MWRNETGLVEMLLTYINEFNEFQSYANWRMVLVDILTNHEETRRQRTEIAEEFVNQVTMDDEIVMTSTAERMKDDNAFSQRPFSTSFGEDNGISVNNDVGPNFSEPMNHSLPSTKAAIEEATMPTNECEESMKKQLMESMSFQNKDLMSGIKLETANHDSAPSPPWINRSAQYGESPFGNGSEPVLDNCSDAKTDTSIAPCTSRYAEDIEPKKEFLLVEENSEPFDDFYDSTSAAELQMRPDTLTVRDEVNKASVRTDLYVSSDPIVSRVSGGIDSRKYGREKGLNEEESRALVRERPFQCHLCGKRFKQSSHRKVHIQTHTGERPFSCKFCGKSYSRVSGLKNHISKYKDVHQCSVCNKTFCCKLDLQRHLAMHFMS